MSTRVCSGRLLARRGVRLVGSPARLGRPDLVILPGTKATVADLAWVRDRALDRAIEASGAVVLGLRGGHQMWAGGTPITWSRGPARWKGRGGWTSPPSSTRTR